MIKLIAAVRRKRGLSKQEYAAHYKEKHGPLVASVSAFRRHVYRYVQNFVPMDLSLQLPGYDAERDAVTEVWFADVETFNRAYQESDYSKYLRPDEQRFVDMEGLIVGIATETDIFERAAGEAHSKALVFRKRRPGVDQQTFQKHWRETYAPRLAANPAFQQRVRRYRQDHMIALDTELPGDTGYDLVDELWFDSMSDAVAFCSQPEGPTQECKHDGGLLDYSANLLMLVTEHEAIAPSH